MATVYKAGEGWRAQIRMKGKPTTSKVHSTKKDAQIWARDQEHQLARSKSDNPFATYSEIYAVYKEHARQGGKSMQSALKKLEAYWGTWRMTEITTSTVSTYASKLRREGLGPSTVLCRLVYLGVVLKHGGVLSGNDEALRARVSLAAAISTLRSVGAIADSTERDRRPTEEELMMIEEYLAPPRSQVPAFDAMLFGICTCMRLGEITRLQFTDINTTKGIITIRNRKDPRNRSRTDVIPVPVGVVTYRGKLVNPWDIIERRREITGGKGRVFGTTGKYLSRLFTEAVDNCQIGDLRFHDLRHEGVSRLFEHGLDIPEVASISGHKSWRHLKRYTHLRPDHLKNKHFKIT